MATMHSRVSALARILQQQHGTRRTSIVAVTACSSTQRTALPYWHITNTPSLSRPLSSAQQHTQPSQSHSQPGSTGTSYPHTKYWILHSVGEPNSRAFRLFFLHPKTQQRISPWHHIPLLSSSHTTHKGQENGLYHYVNEIPYKTIAKMEVSTKEAHNPIAQDIKKDKLRVFTYGDIPFNYGLLPQTWEDPGREHTELTGLRGDNDPVDVVEISDDVLDMGSVHAIRVLGALALIDEGELDWKIIGIHTAAKHFATMHTLDDVPQHTLDTIRDWFINYKTTDGKPKNNLAYDGRFLDKRQAQQVITETHSYWQDLTTGKTAANGLWIETPQK